MPAYVHAWAYEQLANATSVEHGVELIRQGSGFSQQAAIELMRVGGWLPTSKHEEWLRGHQLGLERFSVLWRVRQQLALPFPGSEPPLPSREASLILWGAELACGEQGLQDLAWSVGLDRLLLAPKERAVFLHEWVAAHGVPSAHELAAWAQDQARARHLYHVRVLRRQKLSHPVIRGRYFAELDRRCLDWAVARAAGNPILAHHLFSCLARINAYRRGPYVRWNGRWLQAGSTPNPIPGTSGTKTRNALQMILHEAVLEKIEGHSAGRFCAAYRVCIDIPGGAFNRDHAATELGLVLDNRHRPQLKR